MKFVFIMSGVKGQRQMKHHDKSALMGSNKYSWGNMKGGGVCAARKSRWSSWRNNLQLIPDVSGLNTKLDPLWCSQCSGARNLAAFCAEPRIPSSRNPIKMHCFASFFFLITGATRSSEASCFPDVRSCTQRLSTFSVKNSICLKSTSHVE